MNPRTSSWRRSLTIQAIVLGLVLGSLNMFTLPYVLSWAMDRNHLPAVESEGRSSASLLAQALGAPVAAGELERTNALMDTVASRDDVRYVAIRSADGRLLQRRGEGEPTTAALSGARDGPVSRVSGHEVTAAAPIAGAPHGAVIEIGYAPTNRVGSMRYNIFMVTLAFLLGLTIFTIVVLLGVTHRLVVGPVNRMTHVARAVTGGDLRVKPVVTRGHNEIALLGRSINAMAEAMRASVSAIRDASSEVMVGAAQAGSASAQLASSASEQASAITETTATVEEVKQTGEATRRSAGEIVDASERSVEISGQGIRALEETVSVMKQVRDQSGDLAVGITSLRTQLAEVDEIVASVNEVAAQSNLLAVNASIEAAKAGEFGRGFAVVASEVKKLATQSKQATERVRTTLGSLQRATEQLGQTAHAGREQIERGAATVDTSGQVIQELAEVIDRAADAARRIAINANEQVVGLTQISQAMVAINHAANETLESAQQVDGSSANLNNMVHGLESLVAQYRLSS